MADETIGTYQYSCHEGVFPLGTDSVELGNFATVKKNWSVCDLGTGSGLLLLLLADREPTLKLSGIEMDETSVANARENLSRNGLTGEIIHEDLRKKLPVPRQFDLVVANPPYFSVESGAVKNAARSELTCTLEELCTTAVSLVKSGGRFALVHRPERLVEVLCTLHSVGLEPKRMKLVSHSPAHPPSAVLIECIRQARAGLSIET